jgi:twitching motility two-component system response regulator PilG
MFTLTLGRALRYQLLNDGAPDEANLFLVDGADTTALAVWRAEQARLSRPTVFVGESAPSQEWPMIRRPLLLPRVLAALDGVAKGFAERQLAALRGDGPKPARPLRAMVVDDSEPVVTFLQALLAQHGITPTLAASGEEALVKMSGARYDLVLLDIVLPGIDGYEVCRQIKLQSPAPKVLMITHRDNAYDKIRGSLAGCDAWFTKPLDQQRLHALLREYAQLPIGS